MADLRGHHQRVDKSGQPVPRMLFEFWRNNALNADWNNPPIRHCIAINLA